MRVNGGIGYRRIIMWKNKKVFVTGADGFIGSHLVEKLHELGAKVTAFVKYTLNGEIGNLKFLNQKALNEIVIIPGNVEDSSLVLNSIADHDVVFHLAALITIPYSYVAPRSYVRTNIDGTLNVLEACRFNKVSKMVHTSTSEAYGTAKYTPIDEKHPLQGQSPYSASKIGADKIVESFYCSFNTPVSTLRPFNTYGPRQSGRALIPNVISQAISQNEICVGSVDPVRDMNYVEDTVNAFILNAESNEAIGKVINAGSGKGYAVLEIIEKIRKITHSEHKNIVSKDQRKRPVNSEVMNLVCNNRLAKEIMGWEPKVSLDDGLLKTMTFVSENIGLYNSGRYMK